MVLFVLIIISGLRYRLGTDTIAYYNDFKDYPSLFNLTWETFTDFRYQPLWIIFNSFCKFLGDFTYVQLIHSAIHIGIWGYVLKKICPSLLFTSLLLYYLYDYTMYNMEVMRESLAISFFLLFLQSLHRKKIIKTILYAIIAILFHIFAFLIITIFLFYYFAFANKPKIGLIIVFFFSIASYINKDFMMNFILTNMADGSADAELLETAAIYANRESVSISLIETIRFITQPIILLSFLSLIRPIYAQFINLKWRIFSTTIWLAVILIFCNYSMPIMNRLYHYFSFHTSLLFAVFIVHMVQTRLRANKLFAFGFFVIIACLFPIKFYISPAPFSCPNERWYSLYYPYSSIFDQSMDKRREHIFNYRDDL